jgi:MFS family permease
MSAEASGLRALRERAFLIFWLGHTFSSVGTKMQQTALLWHIYELTQDMSALGLMGAVKLAPMVTLVLLGGVLADRMSRRRVLIWSQITMGLLALALGILCLGGISGPLALYVVAALTEGASAFDAPARKALLPQLVPPEALSSALTLTSISKNAAKLVGPALMGVMVAYTNIGWVYVVNGLSFIAVLASLSVIPDKVMGQSVKVGQGTARAIAEGARFLGQSRVLVSMVLLDFCANLWAAATVLLPVYAQEVLGLEAQGYGLLASAIAAGGLLASFALLALPEPDNKGRWVVLGSLGFGLGTALLGVSQSLWLSMVALAIVGGMDQVSSVFRNTINQVATPDALRGRVTALNTLFNKSGPRLGELEAALAASLMGLTPSLIFGGVACVLTTGLIVGWHPPLWSWRSSDQPAEVPAGTPGSQAA